MGGCLIFLSVAFSLRVQILKDKDDMNTRQGRAAFGILLFQVCCSCAFLFLSHHTLHRPHHTPRQKPCSGLCVCVAMGGLAMGPTGLGRSAHVGCGATVGRRREQHGGGTQAKPD
jgi:hypothetical protein